MKFLVWKFEMLFPKNISIKEGRLHTQIDSLQYYRTAFLLS